MKYTLVYGAIAGAIAISLMSATIALDLTGHDSTSMLVGYLIMLAALSLIFVGVKRYRDVECGGIIRFGRAFLLGLGIAVVAGLIYAIGWEAYLAASGSRPRRPKCAIWRKATAIPCSVFRSPSSRFSRSACWWRWSPRPCFAIRR
jgi:hypothetical protein